MDACLQEFAQFSGGQFAKQQQQQQKKKQKQKKNKKHLLSELRFLRCWVIQHQTRSSHFDGHYAKCWDCVWYVTYNEQRSIWSISYWSKWEINPWQSANVKRRANITTKISKPEMRIKLKYVLYIASEQALFEISWWIFVCRAVTLSTRLSCSAYICRLNSAMNTWLYDITL